MRRLARAATLVSSATLVSRVLGLARDVLRAALVGSGALNDALEVAFKIPNLLRDLFAEGAFNGAFVPTLSETKEKSGGAAALELVNRVLSTMLLYAGGAVVLLILFAPGIVFLVTDSNFSDDPAKFDEAVRLARMLAPYLLLVSLAAVVMGALNVQHRFFLPALSPALQNLVLVLGGGILLALGLSRFEAVVPWAVLLLAGGAVQFLVQLPALRREGWKPRLVLDPFLRDPALAEIARRMAPVVLGMAATHLSILVNLRLASRFDGGVSYLYYGFRLAHLPVGLIGVAVGTVTLAQASRLAARNDLAGVGRTMGQSLRLCLAFALPAAAGLAVLGNPLSRLIFHHGATSAVEAERIGHASSLYALAVVPYCCVKVLVPVFFALKRVRVPVVASVLAVAANIAVAVWLVGEPGWEWRAMAVAVAAGQTVNLLVLLLAARHHFRGASPGFLSALLRLVLATAASVAAAYGTLQLLAGAGVAFQALVPVAAGIAAYVGAGWLLRSEEIREVLRLGPRSDVRKG